MNYVSAEEAAEDPDVMLGTLLVNHHPASVLFDTGSSHSFISESYAQLHNMSFCDMPIPLVVQTPGSKWQTSRITYDNEILVDMLVFSRIIDIPEIFGYQYHLGFGLDVSSLCQD